MAEKAMDYNRLIDIAAQAGVIMLENGAETYRVEDTINRIISLSGLKDSSSIVIATAIVVSLAGPNMDAITVVKRVSSRGTDLNKICQINDMSRQLCKGIITLEEAEEKIRQTRKGELYGPFSYHISIVGITIIFTLLSGGWATDALCAAFIGLILSFVLESSRHMRINSFFQNLASAATVALLTTVLSSILPFPVHSSYIIIGCIMPLVPGVYFTNGIRDILYGDYTAAIARITEAVVIATAIAVGVGLGISLSQFI